MIVSSRVGLHKGLAVSVIFLVVATFVSGCNSNENSESAKSVSESGWYEDSQQLFTFEMPDSFTFATDPDSDHLYGTASSADGFRPNISFDIEYCLASTKRCSQLMGRGLRRSFWVNPAVDEESIELKSGETAYRVVFSWKMDNVPVQSIVYFFGCDPIRCYVIYHRLASGPSYLDAQFDSAMYTFEFNSESHSRRSAELADPHNRKGNWYADENRVFTFMLPDYYTIAEARNSKYLRAYSRVDGIGPDIYLSDESYGGSLAEYGKQVSEKYQMIQKNVPGSRLTLDGLVQTYSGITGHMVAYRSITYGRSCRNVQYSFPKNDTMYLISYSCPSDVPEMIDNDFHDAMKSFEFVQLPTQ